MAIMYDQLKMALDKKEEPEDENLKKLFIAQNNVNNARQNFKNQEKEKNKIWGFVK